ncbi:MAG TPA: hypothetical protein VIJ47_04220 [Acidimicrobiales bacterium]
MTGDEPDTRTARHNGLVLAGVASLSAGAIHAAAVGAHAEHPAAARVFIVVALVQLAWGALALARPGRAVAIAGVAVNVALVAGWALAKTKGLTFIDGLDQVEPVQFADGLAAALAAVAGVGSAWALRRSHRTSGDPVFVVLALVALAVVAFPGMVEAGNHVHAHVHAADSVVVGADGQAALTQAAAAVPTKPYDPTKPIDLGGVAGVTPEQQARAENEVAITVMRLPQWADPAVAEAAGYRSIGDGLTGFEHYINWASLTDGKILDPDHPESLVYRVTGSTKTLAAAMYMLPPGSTLDTVPDVGGALTQWHIHDNLCFTAGDAPRVVGLTDGAGRCASPFVKLQPVPMIHVWIIPQACGPFSALEGVGGGQIKPGEQRLCDHVHGSGL